MARNEKSIEAEKLYRNGMKLVDIASKLNVPSGTVRRWKSTYKWDGEQKSERSDKKANARKEQKTEIKTVVADEVKSVVENLDLTEKQRLFCIYYIRSFNATKAYQKAYECDYTTALVNGSRLLGNARIKTEILRLKQERLNREFLSETDIFQKYMEIAYADMTDFAEFGNKEIEIIDDDGQKRKITVSHVNIKNSNEVDGTLISEISTGKAGVKIKLIDKMKALQWLTDHMDLATEEQRARITLLKAKSQDGDSEEIADDGFLEALNGSAGEDWSDEAD